MSRTDDEIRVERMEAERSLGKVWPVVPDTAALSAQTEACRALSAEVERLKAELAALRDDGELLGEVYTTDGVGIVMQTVANLRAERDAALAVIAAVRGLCDKSGPRTMSDGVTSYFVRLRRDEVLAALAPATAPQEPTP